LQDFIGMQSENENNGNVLVHPIVH